MEFRARALTAWEEERLVADLQNRLPEYPQRQSERHQEGSLHFGPIPKAHVEDMGWMGICFTSVDGKQIARFHRDRFIYARLAPYENWEAFQAEGLRLWSTHCELAAPDEIQRVGVRFINQLPIPVAGADFDDFLHAAPMTPKGLESLPLSGFLHQENFVVPGYPYGVTVIRTVQPPLEEQPGVAQLILDIDVFTTEPLPVEEELIKARLREMRWLKNKVFFGSVSDKVVKSLQEGI